MYELNKNILCCIECLLNNTFTCDFCINSNDINYDYKIKRNDEITAFSNCVNDEKLSMTLRIRKLLKYFENMLIDDIDDIGELILQINSTGLTRYKNISIKGCYFYDEENLNFVLKNHNDFYTRYNKFVTCKININDTSNKIKKIIFNNIQINELINLPENLEKLICKNTLLTNLNNLPKKLKYLICSNNKIENLDNLPNSIKYLNCSNNKIENLDYLNEGLEYLDCSNNQINNLDNLPNSIKYLFTNGNNIKNMLFLPKKLLKLNSASYSDSESREKCIKLLQKFNYTIAYK